MASSITRDLLLSVAYQQFERTDANHDGVVNGERHIGDAVDGPTAVVDLDGDGRVTREDFDRVALQASPALQARLVSDYSETYRLTHAAPVGEVLRATSGYCLLATIPAAIVAGVLAIVCGPLGWAIGLVALAVHLLATLALFVASKADWYAPDTTRQDDATARDFAVAAREVAQRARTPAPLSARDALSAPSAIGVSLARGR